VDGERPRQRQRQLRAAHFHLPARYLLLPRCSGAS
jgi:hypothetical protein